MQRVSNVRVPDEEGVRWCMYRITATGEVIGNSVMLNSSLYPGPNEAIHRRCDAWFLRKARFDLRRAVARAGGLWENQHDYA